jgi:hypothetical protein
MLDAFHNKNKPGQSEINRKKVRLFIFVFGGYVILYIVHPQFLAN